jgi:hypothetical protein
LTKDQYDKVGGLKGLIEDAAERALRGLAAEEPLPPGPPSKLLEDLGASAFVPALAQINDQGAIIRRIAEWISFIDEIDAIGGRRGGGSRPYVAEQTLNQLTHEALFGELTRLKGWLEPERARLEALRSLQVDAATWDRNGRDTAFLNHRKKRLGDATALVATERYRRRLGKLELGYVAACEVAEGLAKRQSGKGRCSSGCWRCYWPDWLGWWDQNCS